MTHSDHQLERMRHWSQSYAAATVHACNPAWQGARDDFADSALAEFDKRFPAPAAVEVAPISPDERHDYAMLAKEVGILRTKARLWDAVASGKVDLVRSADGDGFYANDKFRATAAEAVQAAIDAGALK